MPGIVIDGVNFIASGWLACFLGMPREFLGQEALKDADLKAWRDGFDACGGDNIRLLSFRRMVTKGLIVAQWEHEA